jgi:hypothetical protein
MDTGLAADNYGMRTGSIFMAMRLTICRVILVGLLVGLAGCGYSENKTKVDDAVRVFHQQFNDSQYSEIYGASTSAFRSSGSQAGFVAYLEGVRRKIGRFKTSTPGSTKVSNTTSGTFVSLSCNAQFDQDTAVEEFTFQIVDQRAVLQHYNINSRELISK